MGTKYIWLLWSGIFRKRGRTVLAFLQIAIAFALFGLLQGLKTGADRAIAAARADLLDVRPSIRGAGPLPLAYLDRIKKLPGVKSVTLVNGFSATYQTATQPLYALAIDPEVSWLTQAPEIFQVSPGSLDALARSRTGALVTQDLEKKYHWKVGDRVPLIATDTAQRDGADHWTFDIVGEYTLHELGGDTDIIVVNNSYLDEARASDKGTAQHFHVVAADPRQATAVAEAIDREFRNSTNETRTQSYRETAQREMKSIGDLEFAIRAIVGAVFVALLFSTGTMTMQAVRERTSEFAILKAIGFSDRAVFVLVATEALVIWTLAATFGLSLALIAFPYATALLPGTSMPWVIVEISLAASVFVALATMLIPALQAARLSVAPALAGR